jgi:tRNA dimethylallyltransferase
LTDSRILVIIGGPTASGKTDLAVSVAEHFSAEIISADSRQLFKELNIGTAKPGPEEIRGVHHHFINTHSIVDEFSAGDFADQGTGLIEDLFSEHEVVVVAGGSGLYIDALLFGVDELPGKDEELRREMDQVLKNEGITALQSELKRVDPETYSKIDINNPQRIIRALEIQRTTGQKASSLKHGSKRTAKWPFMIFGIQYGREELYRRINERVDAMFSNGLIDEVRSVLEFRDRNALQTVGYKEVFSFIDGDISKDECIELVKKHTRNYAKRQLTWFRKYPEMIWVEPGDHISVIRSIERRIRTKG